MCNLFYYKLFGLSICSDISFEGINSLSSIDADVFIRLKKIDCNLNEDEQVKFIFGDDEQILIWSQVGKFRVIGNDQIEVDPNPGISSEQLALPLFGRVFATLLHARGNLVLHASSVSIGGKGIAFLGNKKAGKSTTAGVFVAAGYELVSDDIVCLNFDNTGNVVVQSAFAEIKLWEDAKRAIELDAVNVGNIFDTKKSKHWLRNGFNGNTANMKYLFLLERDQATKIEPFEFSQAFTILLRYTYLAEFGSSPFFRAHSVNHMKLCAEISKLLFISRLRVPSDVYRLKEVIDVVGEELRNSSEKLSK